MSLLEKRGQELAQGLSRTIARLGEEVSPKSVHHLRSTIRRIDSLVAFASPHLGRKQRRALDDLAALRKRAGKVRDLDVQMGLLGTIANGSTASDRRELAGFLETKRARQAKRLRAHIDSLRETRFLAHLERIGEEVGSLSQRTASAPMEEARRQLSQLAAEYGSRMAIEPRLLHQVRIRLKMIRYLAEAGAGSAEQRRMLGSLKAAQDALGAWHDWENLMATAEKLLGERLHCPLLLEIRALLACRYAVAAAAVARLLADWAPSERKRPASLGASAAMARSA
jgi:CHAD domain-containing protein